MVLNWVWIAFFVTACTTAVVRWWLGEAEIVTALLKALFDGARSGFEISLGLAGVMGNLQPGCEADFVVLNPAATPLLERKTRQASSLDELLFAMIVLGDDRLVERTVIGQALSA